MICEILLPLPIKKTFYYTLENSIIVKVGSLVEVEFGKKILIGLVINLKSIKEFDKPLKSVRKVFDKLEFNQEILDSINFISAYSCNHSSMILKLFLSSFPKKDQNHNKIEQKLFTGKKKKLKLNLNQKNVIRDLKEINLGKFNSILLQGVTGSGKTRVYMHKVREALENGYQCLILVPEIILTTQWVEEIQKDFSIDIAVYHSSINKKKKEQIWLQTNNKTLSLVIGTRSALFLPFSNLGLIIIDEEHDSSYKQEEQIIINARDFAVVRAKNSNCMIILTSATPSLESFWNVKLKKFLSLKLSKRVNNASLPKIQIVDMKREKDIISEKLVNCIRENIKNNHQTLIFINKRGYAPFVICKNCGFVKLCKKCNTSLVLHDFKNKNNSYFLCHHCNYKEIFTNKCSKCDDGNDFYYPGLGIEKVYESVENLFPTAKKCLLSSDKTRNTKTFKDTILKITSNEIDIIIGTQLISKGHNFPSLKTVGIINIDNLINDFDFRSYEKTFQQIIQVGGRAGRVNLDGEVLIQTFQPNHPVMEHCKHQDVNLFNNWELKLRKENDQPPFVRLISVIVSSKKERSVISFSQSIINLIKTNFKNLSTFGPAPAILFKKNLQFRYRILIKLNKNFKEQKNIKDFLMKIDVPKELKLYIDVDPFNFI